MTQQRADYPLDYTKTRDQGTAGRPRAMVEGATDRVRDVAADAQELAGKVAEQTREYAEKAQDVARNFKPYVEKSMKEQPMATLAIASVIGFILGALWKK